MQTLGVVPIFVSAGAAVLPTIVGAVVSIAAVMLKPRELARLARRRPMASAVGMLVIASVVLGTWWIATATRAAGAGGTVAGGVSGKVDWVKVAEDIRAREALGQAPTVPGVGPATRIAGPTGPATREGGTGGGEGGSAVVEGRDFSRTGYGGGPSPVRLMPLWSYRPEGVMFLAAPAIVGKRIYVAGCVSDLGGYTGVLACLDAETGRPVWELTELKGEPMKPFFSSPAVTADGKRLVIGQGLHADKNCELLCFDTETKELKWSVKTTLHIESSPAIFGTGEASVAVVGAGAIEGPNRQPTGDPGFVMGVRIADGKLLWKLAVNDPESSPAIDENGMVYIGSGVNGNAVLALRGAGETDDELKAKGLTRIAWRREVEYPVTSAISLIGDLVVAGAGNGDVVKSAPNPRGLVVAIDRKTGEVKWKKELRDSVVGGVAVRGEAAIAPVRTGEVVALALKDGEVLWENGIGNRSPVLASCAVTGEAVYAVSGDGTLRVMQSNGKLLERHSLNDQANPGSGLSMSPPQVINGRVIVGSETGGMRCYVGTGVTP
jgi:outer membrane protein assembly factor BamB